jgi:protein-S-isoprenylcysteine O-methyltransferase Ste14
MHEAWALLSLLSMFGLVCLRALQLKRQGVTAFAENAQNLLFVAPFLVFFVYCIATPLLHLPLPTVLRSPLVGLPGLPLLGHLLSFAGLLLLAYSLRSFGDSFRVGIDDKRPGRLVTAGAFALSRNPIYVSFAFVFGGIAMAVPALGTALALLALAARIHAQVLREEAFCSRHYGDEYRRYCAAVRRYL